MHNQLKVLCLVLFFLGNLATGYASQGDNWFSSLDKREFVKGNQLSQYQKYDFSSLLIPRSYFLGFIGSNYNRLHIQFNSIVKDSKNPKLYRVVGYSRVLNGEKTEFRGFVELTSVFEIRHSAGCENEDNSLKIKTSGLLIAKYKFDELSSSKHAGVFNGIMHMDWLLDREGEIQYDDINGGCSDLFSQNQYIGTWKSYSGGVEKVANWGEYRIPYSGDLDSGVGEFSVNKKYCSRGWYGLPSCEKER